MPNMLKISLGRYSESARFVAFALLMLLYVCSIVMLYRYDVVANGLYFSFGFDSDLLPITIIVVWFFGVLNLGAIGDYRRIDSAYKLFSLMFILIVSLPTLLFADLAVGDFKGAIFFDMALVSVVLSLLTRVSVFGVLARYPLRFGAYYVPVFICLFYIVYMYFLYPGELRLVDLNSVYELREQAKNVQGDFLKYFVGFIFGVAAPFCLVFGLYKRNVFFVIAAIASYLLFYMSAGHKSAIITVALVVLIYFLSERLTVRFALCMAVLGMTSIFLMDWYFFHGIVAAFTFDRMIVAPSSLTIMYYDFFQDNPKFFLSHSVLSGLFDNPYAVTPQQVIGSAYFSNDWANVNFVGEGFANFGRLGVFFYALFVIFAVKVYDLLSRDLPARVRLSLFVPALFYLLNASPLTLMLSGGYVGLILVLYVRARQRHGYS